MEKAYLGKETAEIETTGVKYQRAMEAETGDSNS